VAKSLKQRLQSRISIRRNLIAELEEGIVEQKYIARQYREAGQVIYARTFSSTAREIRREVTQIGRQQRLDKDLVAHLIQSSNVIIDLIREVMPNLQDRQEFLAQQLEGV
jgi:predicted ribosome quality control (RQC) complex YloA/Tae2 family protein